MVPRAQPVSTVRLMDKGRMIALGLALALSATSGALAQTTTAQPAPAPPPPPLLIDTGTPPSASDSQQRVRSVRSSTQASQNIFFSGEATSAAVRFNLPTGNGNKYAIQSLSVFGRGSEDALGALRFALDQDLQNANGRGQIASYFLNRDNISLVSSWVDVATTGLLLDPGNYWVRVVPGDGQRTVNSSLSGSTELELVTFTMPNGLANPALQYATLTSNYLIFGGPPQCDAQFPNCADGSGSSTNTGWQAGGSWGFRVAGAQQALVAAPPPVGGIPEPSTWAMMILGFGLVGGALRHSRRRRSGAVAQAVLT